MRTDDHAPVSLLVLDGDGISPEIIRATLDVLDAVQRRLDLPFDLTRAEVGLKPLATFGTTVPDKLLDQARAADGVILGPVSHNDYPPESEGGINPSGFLRKHLDLFANIRPALSHPDFPARCGVPVDLVIVRENTEGFYADRTMFAGTGEFMPTQDVAIAMRKVTREGSTRIAEAAFRIARQRGGKLTVVHKANVLRISDGLFLACTREVAKAYPDIAVEEILVDAMAALLVRDASAFDTIVTTNMFGDILSDQATEIAGSIGLAASLNAGADHAMAQAQHGSAPTLAGQDRANPASLINSTAMLLRWLGGRRADPRLHTAARMIEQAVATVIAVPQWRTGDMGGPLGTSAFAAKIVAAIETTQAGEME
ncbi:isocitrate/isopropylmalate dehydrogenase family protein [Yoonia sp.]|uniref:isocitrate/isopropylmalate dehydrogenase family protein n=1 Tax=Yoonia sp. TaxID=2212373 RepID=UPI00391D15A7